MSKHVMEKEEQLLYFPCFPTEHKLNSYGVFVVDIIIITAMHSEAPIMATKCSTLYIFYDYFHVL